MHNLKSLLTFIAICCIYFNSNAQCSVTKKNIDGGTGYETKFETIYKNEDLENGIYLIGIKTVAIDTDEGFAMWINAMVTSKRPKAPLIPRKLDVTFSDNSMIHLSAETHDSRQVGSNATGNICQYPITAKEFDQLAYKEIKSITVSDNRTGQLLSSKPYSKILLEQFECIIKEQHKSK